MLSSAAVSFVGHSTVLIEDGGVRLLTDPLLRGRLGHLRRHGAPVAATSCSQLDGVLISHLHHDHFDRRSLQLLDRSTRMIVPLGGGALTRSLGFSKVDEVRDGDQLTVGALTVSVVHAEHSPARPGRGQAGGHQAQPVGYVTEASRRIYFAGDTDIFAAMQQISQPQLDLALLPVWGWGPTLGAGHLDPRAAAEALRLLAAELAVPIHWGTLYPIGLRWLRPRALTDPPQLFKRYAADLSPRSEVKILVPGERLALD